MVANPKISRFLLAAALLAGAPSRALAIDAVVGDGNPSSCTEAALDVAIAAANAGGGTVTFACGEAPLTIALSAAKTLTSFVTLDGDGRIVLSGGGLTRHLVVSSGGVATLRELVLRAGHASSGGAVELQSGSELHMYDSSLIENVATGDGGAIAASGAVVHLVRSSAIDNQAGGSGGAIALSGGRLDMGLSVLHRNQAAGDGGGAVIASCTQLAVIGSSFDRNSAGGSGGGLRVGACSGFVDQSELVLNLAGGVGGGLHLGSGAAVSLNYVTVGGNVADEGGGLFLDSGSSSIARQVTVSENQAVAGSARGGGVANLGTLQLENATLSGNLAAGPGGGIHSETSATLRFVTVAWNQAVSGGGLSSTGDALLLRNVILAGDAAAGGSEECAISGAADIASSLWQGTSCGATGTNGNQPATDPLLSPLGYSCASGTTLELTRTHDLDASSPAIDAGVPLGGGNAFMDQRTVLRPQGLAPDIGAVEFIVTSCPWLFLDGFERGNTFSWSTRVD